jgi:hypothetical protein
MTDYIIEFENQFPDDFCDDLINICNTNYKVGTGQDFMLSQIDIMNRDKLKLVKTSEDVELNYKDIEFNETYHRIMKKVKSKYSDILIEKNLDKHVYDGGPYILGNTIRNSRQSDVVIQRSIVGQQYNWHTDFVLPKMDQDYLATKTRLLTCILYLNDMEDDAGGCTEFTCGRIVKPKKGKVLIFPSTVQYLHRGTIVKKGCKYIITTFSYIGGEPSLPSLPFIIQR